MRLRYTSDALAHLSGIRDFLAERNPSVARRILVEIRLEPNVFASFLRSADRENGPARGNGLCNALLT